MLKDTRQKKMCSIMKHLIYEHDILFLREKPPNIVSLKLITFEKWESTFALERVCDKKIYTIVEQLESLTHTRDNLSYFFLK